MNDAENISSMFNNIDMVLLAFLVVFLLISFKKVLGKRVGYSRNEKSGEEILSQNPIINSKQLDEDQVNPYPVGSLMHNLYEIKKIDPSFDNMIFLDGAKKCYKLVVENFYMGNLDIFKNYVSQRVYDSLYGVVQKRSKSINCNILVYKYVDFMSVEFNGDTVSIGVNFTTMQSFDLKKEQEVSEVCTFVKNFGSPDAMWILSKIS